MLSISLAIILAVIARTDDCLQMTINTPGAEPTVLSSGTPLAPNTSDYMAVQTAVNIVRGMEQAGCLPSSETAGNKTPGEKLQDSLAAGEICVETVKDRYTNNDGSTTLKDEGDTSPPDSDGLNITNSNGINISPNKIPSSPAAHPANAYSVTGPDGTEYTFDKQSLITLASVLYHEQFHRDDDTSENKKEAEDAARAAQIDFLCAAINCAALGLSDDDKTGLCIAIAALNKMLCQSGKPTVTCEHCGEPEPCEGEDSGTSRFPAPIMLETFTNELFDGFVSVSAGTSTLTWEYLDYTANVALTRTVNVKNLTFGPPLGGTAIQFSPTAISVITPEHVLLAGHDSISLDSVIVRVRLTLAQGSGTATIKKVLYKGTAFGETHSIDNVPGRQALAILDSTNGQAVYFDLQTSSTQVICSTADHALIANAQYIDAALHRSASTGTWLGLTVTVSDGPMPYAYTDLTAADFTFLVVDTDDDGLFDIKRRVTP